MSENEKREAWVDRVDDTWNVWFGTGVGSDDLMWEFDRHEEAKARELTRRINRTVDEERALTTHNAAIARAVGAKALDSLATEVENGALSTLDGCDACIATWIRHGEHDIESGADEGGAEQS